MTDKNNISITRPLLSQPPCGAMSLVWLSILLLSLPCCVNSKRYGSGGSSGSGGSYGNYGGGTRRHSNNHNNDPDNEDAPMYVKIIVWVAVGLAVVGVFFCICYRIRQKKKQRDEAEQFQQNTQDIENHLQQQQQPQSKNDGKKQQPSRGNKNNSSNKVEEVASAPLEQAKAW